MRRRPLHPLLRDLYDAEVARLPAGTRWLDVHTHVGQNDPDGVTGTVEELYADLEEAGHEQAIVFAMHEPGGYREPNARTRELAAASGGRLRSFARIDPNSPDALDEARRGLEEGAVGFKLHPRSDAFGLPHATVTELAAIAAAAKVPILFHAGRGIPLLGEAATALAHEHPDVRLILAHAGVSDLGWIADEAAALPNLFFDTAWWQASDMLQLFTTIPPQNILFASDSPYGRSVMAGIIFLRGARAAGLSAEQRGVIAGAQAMRLLDREDPIELGPAPGFSGEPAARRLDAERAMAYVCAAAQLMFRDHDATEPMALARLACQRRPGTGSDPVMELVDELIAAAHAEREAAEKDPDPPRWAGGELLITAQIVAGTAAAGV